MEYKYHNAEWEIFSVQDNQRGTCVLVPASEAAIVKERQFELLQTYQTKWLIWIAGDDDDATEVKMLAKKSNLSAEELIAMMRFVGHDRAPD